MKLSGIILCIIFLQACTIKYSFTGTSISPEIKTVSIEYFDNVAELIQPTLSDYFTETLREKFITETNLRLINGEADMNFSGKIIGYNQRHAAVQADETAAKNRLTITVNVVFVNNKEPSKNFEQNFSRFGDFDSNKSLDEVEQSLI
ncbi:MAG: LptE family protein, partial [Bacteroidales bacterium]